jgi:hypothetical protein
LPPQRQIELSGPFPGCIHFGGAAGRTHEYRSVGQTEHCVIFYPAEDVGCTKEKILNHRRQSGEYVRGYVLDLLLGKESSEASESTHS